MIAIATRGVLYHSSVVTPLPASPSSPASSSSSSVSDSLSTSSRPSSSSSPSGVMGGAAVAGRDHAFNSFASHPTNRHRSDQIRSGKAGQGEVQLVVGGRGQGGAAWRTSEEMVGRSTERRQRLGVQRHLVDQGDHTPDAPIALTRCGDNHRAAAAAAIAASGGAHSPRCRPLLLADDGRIHFPDAKPTVPA